MASARLAELEKLACPLCGKTLAAHEFNRARKELEKRVSQEFKEQSEKKRQEFQRQLNELQETHRKETQGITAKFERQEQSLQKKLEEQKKKDDNEFARRLEKMKKDHKIELEQLKELHKKQNFAARKELEKSFNRQLEAMKRHYESLAESNDEQLQMIEKRLEAEHKRELRKKDMQPAKIKTEHEKQKKASIENARTAAWLEVKRLSVSLQERDIQVERFREQVKVLEKKLYQSQSELQGEAGERDLYSILSRAFPEDKFERQKRGKSSGDIIHRIKTDMGFIETPIVYDNKEAKSVSKKDIEKARNYRKMHGTDYVIIVSKNLPKRDVKNHALMDIQKLRLLYGLGRYGRKDWLRVFGLKEISWISLKKLAPNATKQSI